MFVHIFRRTLRANKSGNSKRKTNNTNTHPTIRTSNTSGWQKKRADGELNGLIRICVNKWRFPPSDSRIFDAGHFPPAGKFAHVHVVVDTNVSSCWRSESKDHGETATSGGQKTRHAYFGYLTADRATTPPAVMS